MYKVKLTKNLMRFKKGDEILIPKELAQNAEYFEDRQFVKPGEGGDLPYLTASQYHYFVNKKHKSGG